MNDPLTSLLKDGLGQIPGTLGAIVMDHDGLVVAESPHSEHPAEWQTLVTELTQSVRALTSSSPVPGVFKRLVVTHQNMTTLVSPLAGESFLALALNPDAMIGRAQFWMNGLILRLNKELLAA